MLAQPYHELVRSIEQDAVMAKKQKEADACVFRFSSAAYRACATCAVDACPG